MLTHSKNALFDIFFPDHLTKSLATLCMFLAFGTSLFAIDPTCVARVDWTTLPSTFTHDATGNRVDQYAEGMQPTSNESPDRQRSGYRHTRSTLQAGNSSDNFHIVDRWGGPVQPYGEWRYPYRPYSVPFGAWGPQNPQVSVQQSNAWGAAYPGFPYGNPGNINGNGGVPPNWNNNGNGMGGFPAGGYGPANSWPGNFAPQGFQGNGFGVGPNNALRPDQDDYYPAAPEPPAVSDRDFFFVPRGQ